MRKASCIAALVTVAVLAVAGCDAGGPPPDTPPPSAPPSSGQEGDMRSRLARALQPVAPETATMVEDGRTRLTEVPTPWLTGWTMIDVLHYGANHPRRVHVALSDDDVAQVLTGRPEAFNAVARGSTGPVADHAAEIARTYVDVTRDFKVWSYRVESVDEIEWLPELDAEQTKERDRLIKEFGSLITAPQAEAEGADRRVTLWTVSGTDLVRHALVVRADGTVQATAVVVAEGIPGPASM